MNLVKFGRFQLSLLCLIIFSLSCDRNADGTDLANEIIYKVGAFEATRYEVEQDFTNFTNANHRVNDRTFESWMTAMRTKAYFLADAYARRYDTLSVIQKKLDFAVKYKIAQEGGYLWKRNVVPKLNVSDAEVAEAYKKRENVYYADLLFFSDERILGDLGKRFSRDASPTFDELLKAFRGRSGVEFASLPLIYPFSQLASVKDKIYEMKVGSVLGPVSMPEGSYVIHLTRKQKRDFLPIEADRKSIEEDLMSLKRNLAIVFKQDSIYRISNVMFNDNNIERLTHWLKNKRTSSPEIDTLVLMTYRFNNSIHRFLVKDYDEFIKYSPMLVGDFSAPQQIRDNLKDQLIRTYLHEEARRLGILTDKAFLLEKQHYYHALLEQHYYAEEIERKIRISEQDLVDFYNKNQRAFPAEQIAWVSFIEFTNEHAAYNGISSFRSSLASGDIPKLSDTTTVQGLLDIRVPERISEGTSWGEENRKQFLSAQENILYGPIRHNDRVYLYYITKKEKERVQEFSAVRDKVHAQLKLVRMGELKKRKTTELKTQFNEDVDGLKAYCDTKCGAR